MIHNINEKRVLNKMIYMYIRENLDEDIEYIGSVDKIIEDVVKELVNDINNESMNKKPLYIDIPSIKKESSVRSSSPIQHNSLINKNSVVYKITFFIYKKVMDKINNQDFYQRYKAISSILIELFRVITSSLLILSVPQDCDGEICTVSELFVINLTLRGTALIINILTLFTFILMYFIELWRENRLIKYLDVNPNLPNDSEYIANIMDILPENKKQKILYSNRYYKYISYIVIITYIINAVLSAFVIHNSYLGTQTYSSLITYFIFMITKITNSYGVVNSEENVFYSAYLKTNVQFNDIDRNYKKLIDL